MLWSSFEIIIFIVVGIHSLEQNRFLKHGMTSIIIIIIYLFILKKNSVFSP
jgi:hypothetical protein